MRHGKCSQRISVGFRSETLEREPLTIMGILARIRKHVSTVRSFRKRSSSQKKSNAFVGCSDNSGDFDANHDCSGRRRSATCMSPGKAVQAIVPGLASTRAVKD